MKKEKNFFPWPVKSKWESFSSLNSLVPNWSSFFMVEAVEIYTTHTHTGGIKWPEKKTQYVNTKEKTNRTQCKTIANGSIDEGYF